MKWNKAGRVEFLKYVHCNKYVTEFAMLPTPILINDDVIRTYIGFVDDNNVGTVNYIDLDANNPSKILGISDSPVVVPGEAGCFDDNGVVPLSVLRNDNAIYLYYVGFQTGVKVPYFMFGNLAISEDNGNSFTKISKSPILDRKGDEVYARCGMNVMHTEEGYKMWYIGSLEGGWTSNGNSLKPLYTMRYTYSKDGIDWCNASKICLRFDNEDEHGFGRPYVWRDNDGYKMLYSIRTYSRGYYIGYAESDNETEWIRKDNLAGIDISTTGWDSENISYPALIKTKDKTYLFYNGNNCGRTGFGYAILD